MTLRDALMQYKEIPPDQDIANIIECYWLCTNTADDYQQQILPDGCIDIVCDLTGFHDIEVIGTYSQTKSLKINHGFKKLGIRFKPGQFRAFTKINAEELKDHEVCIDNYIKPSQKLMLAEKLAGNNGNIIGALNQYLKSALEYDHQYRQLFNDITSKLTSSICSGRVTVDDICCYTGYSRQHLRRLFLEYVGVTLKEFIDITRIRVISQNINHLTYSEWLNTACDAGFHDQSHLSSHFRKYISMSPKKYHDLKATMLHFYNTKSA